MLRKLMIPFLLSPLVLLLACSLVYAYSGYFYVIPTSAPLRECAAPECNVLLTTYRGDKVEILERTSTGWSRVRLVDRTGIGWIPSDWFSYSPDLQAKSTPISYVNTSSLPLRDKPDPDANVITMLHLNDQVEMLGTSAGYAQVRDLQSSKVGWVLPRYLSSASSSSPKSTRHHRRPARKTPPKEEKAPTATPAPPSAM
jgi:uncharacterized protein YgiM (DUF1202 family)